MTTGQNEHRGTSKRPAQVFTAGCGNANNGKIDLKRFLNLFVQVLPLPWRLAGKILKGVPSPSAVALCACSADTKLDFSRFTSQQRKRTGWDPWAQAGPALVACSDFKSNPGFYGRKCTWPTLLKCKKASTSFHGDEKYKSRHQFLFLVRKGWNVEK